MSTTKAADPSRVMTGADILVQSLVDHGVEVIFAYPGGCSMPLHQALTRAGDKLRTILPRHEQGGAFAAQGYARSTGKVGVAMATSGPGATKRLLLATPTGTRCGYLISHTAAPSLSSFTYG